jgi:hypothetical protein
MSGDLQFPLGTARPGDLPAIVGIDDAASLLYADAGLVFGLGSDHPFVLAEIARWAAAIDSVAASAMR